MARSTHTNLTDVFTTPVRPRYPIRTRTGPIRAHPPRTRRTLADAAFWRPSRAGHMNVSRLPSWPTTARSLRLPRPAAAICRHTARSVPPGQSTPSTPYPPTRPPARTGHLARNAAHGEIYGCQHPDDPIGLNPVTKHQASAPPGTRPSSPLGPWPQSPDQPVTKCGDAIVGCVVMTRFQVVGRSYILDVHATRMSASQVNDMLVIYFRT